MQRWRVYQHSTKVQMILQTYVDEDNFDDVNDDDDVDDDDVDDDDQMRPDVQLL